MKRRKYDVKTYYETIICDCGNEITANQKVPTHEESMFSNYKYYCIQCDKIIETKNPLGFVNRVFDNSYAEVEE